MAETLQTKCPACETTFALDAEQLRARDGLVRCGRCSIVFRADRYLVRGSKRGRGKARAAPPRARRSTKETGKAERHTPIPAPAPIAAQEEFLSPLLARLLSAKRPGRMLSVLWGLGAVALAVTLTAQIVFFYASELALHPALRPWVTEACAYLGCEIRPRQDVAAIELLRTSVATHPEQASALRLRLTMVNRANFTQPYPLLELSLTDSAGAVVARRTFAVHQYVKRRDAIQGMLPHVAVDATLDLTKPDARAGGYEIRLVAR